MMNILLERLENLKQTFHFREENGKIIFFKKDNEIGTEDTIKVVFEDYMVHPYSGFTFNDKFNGGICPFERTMYGNLIRDTEKMYYFKLHTERSLKEWEGWCPKKSCTISYL